MSTATMMEEDKHFLSNFWSILLSSFSIIGIEDLGNILLKLKLAPKGNWREFGLGLGLLYPKIENIEANQKDVESCFRECLVCWLRRADKVDEKGLPTWLRLAEVLEEIGDKATAEKLRKENKGIIYTVCSMF